MFNAKCAKIAKTPRNAAISKVLIMYDEVSPAWQLVSIVAEGQEVLLSDINPWNQEWVSLKLPPILVTHPQYLNQTHKMWIYRLKAHPEIKFAAGEYSASVWGFYVPGTEG